MKRDMSEMTEEKLQWVVDCKTEKLREDVKRLNIIIEGMESSIDDYKVRNRILAQQLQELETKCKYPKETTEFEDNITDILDDIKDMLVQKNKAYGDSALNPVRLFSKSDPTEALRVRIDDKLSRLQRGHDAGEDTVKDLIGYLVLLRLAMQET